MSARRMVDEFMIFDFDFLSCKTPLSICKEGETWKLERIEAYLDNRSKGLPILLIFCLSIRDKTCLENKMVDNRRWKRKGARKRMTKVGDGHEKTSLLVLHPPQRTRENSSANKATEQGVQHVSLQTTV